MFVIRTNFLSDWSYSNDDSVEINHNPNWPYSLDHPFRILIIVCLRSGKTNVFEEFNKTSKTRYW